MKNQLLRILCFLFISLSFAQGPPGCVINTWDGSNWSLGIAPSTFTPNPDPTDLFIVIMAGNYNTATHGSFVGCEIRINEGVEVVINPTGYIQVEKAIVNGNLIVEHQGSFIQTGINDTSNDFIIGPNGNATVRKTTTSPFSTAVAYWSTPIKGESIGGTFNSTPSFGGYRYYFITENYQDLTFEENNNGGTTPGVGVDSIDDDGNDWNFAFQGLPAFPGVGYATRQAPGSGAGEYYYEFSGIFNNGEVLVPAIRNDDNLSAPAPGGNDLNPIFIGNPYASAIDLETFLIKNTFDATNNPDGILDGYVAIWSANAPPVNTNNGNQAINFSINDYFYMNFSGGVFKPCSILPFSTCSFDPLDILPEDAPDASISSAQGFFANFSDDKPVGSGNVVFDNTMRSYEHPNENFYKTSNASKSTDLSNKLWLNLNSPTGINENVLLSYVNGGTSGNDGRAYDLDLSTPNTPYSLIYFNIDGSNDRYRIQGKNPSDLSLDEEVSLGFFNSVVGPDGGQEEFAISISKMQGDFINNSTVYLKDNLLDVCHNLSDSVYFFTSDVGVFNDRFTIRYLDCNFSEACAAIYDDIVNIYLTNPKEKCGKYIIETPKDSFLDNSIFVDFGEGVEEVISGKKTKIQFTENGTYTIAITIYDDVTGDLCYSNEISIVVDCLKDDEKDDDIVVNEKVKVYPNPAKDFITVKFESDTKSVKTVSIKNVMGIQVATSKQSTLNISALNTGVYFVEITTTSGKTYRKQLVIK